VITLPAGEVDESVVTAESLPVHEAPARRWGVRRTYRPWE
jgi:hypothetical protein